jgi:hypothetical protein
MTRGRKEYFDQLVWPAAAGNVAWSVFTIALDAAHRPTDFLARIALLLLLAVYLSVEWVRQGASGASDQYGWFSALHIVGLIVISIAAAVGLDPKSLGWALAILLAITAAGHAFGVWGGTAADRGWLAFSNAVGPIVLWAASVLHYLPQSLTPVPVAAGATLTMWLVARFVIIPKFAG